MNKSRLLLAVSLFALSVLFSLWFHDSKMRVAAMIFFTLPPLLLLVGVLRGSSRASFWAGVLGLFWFSHGVMEAYTLADERAYALIEVFLAVAIILASSWPGVSARLGKKKTETGAPE
ncbi:MAG: DUF2069 domain-containing protein [Pseudoxanthomonas sp.]